MGHRSALRIAVALVAGACGCARAQTALDSVLVAEGLDQPLYVTSAPGDFSRVFILERPGRVRILDVASGSLLPAPYLTLSVGSNGEEGLFTGAFHPDYEDNGFVFVCYVSPGPDSRWVVERFTVSGDPNLADPGSGHAIIRLPQAGPQHNGGWIGFAPDGFLFASLGDNGDWNNAQITQNNLRGKVLRLDVSADAFPADPDRNYAIPATNPFVGLPGDDEIWAYGLRNPWRCSVDRETGDLWIGDVGQSAWEEINLGPGPSGPPHVALNYGWNCLEGRECYCGPAQCAALPNYRAPVHAYPHGPLNQCSVTGGYVYRGCAMPDFRGLYFFGDLCAGRVWSMRYEGGQVTELTDRTADLDPPLGHFPVLASLGEDALGELYICSLAGEVYKIVPETFVGPDCNGNGVRDECDIRSGFSPDANGNGIPDECDCYANCNGSFQGTAPTLTVADFSCFQARFVQGHPYADCNASGTLTVADFACFQTKFIQGCP